MNLEHLFTSPDAFDVPASPLQRAICRVIEGRPLAELADRDDVRAALGDVSAIDGQRPNEVDLLCGIRTGKSRLAATLGVFASQTVDVRHLKTGEIPRIPIVATSLQNARAVFDHLAGTVTAKPALRALLVGEPTADTIVLRHPSGRPIEITTVAGSRAGANLVSVWLAGAIFDEYTRMVGSADGFVVNYSDSRRAAIGRLLPGAQLVSIGSPWAPMGPAFERYTAHHGKPSREIVIIKAPAPAMNPQWWTPERCEALRKSDDVAHATDVLAEFSDPESSFIASSEVAAVTRDGPEVLPLRDCRAYFCAVDPGTRGNAFTSIILAGYIDKEGTPKFEVVRCDEWIGSARSPLSPLEVFRDIARLVRPYGIRTIVSDQHSADANIDLAAQAGLHLTIRPITAQNRNELFERLKGIIASGAISIPNDPTLRRDLVSVRRKLTQTGLTYVLPRTPDGRHCDYVPALCLALEATECTAEQVRAQREVAMRTSRIADFFAARGDGTFADRADALSRNPELAIAYGSDAERAVAQAHQREAMWLAIAAIQPKH